MSQEFKRSFLTQAPEAELLRSPAASRVGDLAARSGLFFSHFEYRVALEVPEFWLPIGRPDLGERADWHAGVLAESKYQNFRNDLRIASFHPGHQPKWTAHELCHGLVGFAWRPGAPPLFHALAARLAELLPVVLYYFYDEIGLRRCPQHAFGGSLFAHSCAACEREAAKGPLQDPGASQRFAAEGRAFMERELAAVLRSRRLGRVVNSPWASLDLASDGLAYASSLGPRLASSSFERYIELFHPPGHGHFTDLEGLEARILELSAAILGEGEAMPLPCRPELWAAQDIGWRLLETVAQTEGEASESLDRLIEALAADPSSQTIGQTLQAYEALCEDFELPEAEWLFGVGYPLAEGYGRSLTQIQAGLASAFPLSLPLLEREETVEFEEWIRGFVGADRLERRPLCARFAQWLSQNASPSVSQSAIEAIALEAALRQVPRPDAESLSLGPGSEGDDLRLSPGVSLVRTSRVALQELGLTGPDAEESAEEPDSSSSSDGQPFWLALQSRQDGEIDLIPVPDWLGQVFQIERANEIQVSDQSREEVEDLSRLGILVPVNWRT